MRTYSLFLGAGDQAAIDAAIRAATATRSKIDFRNGKLRLEPNTNYEIDDGFGPVVYRSDENGEIDILEEWLGTTLNIQKLDGSDPVTDPGDPVDSDFDMIIPDRPAKPTPRGGVERITRVSMQMEYSADPDGPWTNISGSSLTGIEGGAYYVRYKATARSFASEAAEVLVTGVSFANKKITGLEPGEEYEIWIEGVKITTLIADLNGEIEINEDWTGEEITLKRVDDGSEIEIDIPAIPDAPVTPAGGAGKITGVDDTMEYSANPGGPWTDITGATVIGLSPDTYYVRYKATASAFASPAKSVSVTPGPAATPAATFSYAEGKLINLVPSAVYIIEGTEYTADAAGKIIIENDWFDSTIDIVRKGDGTTTINSAAQSLAIPDRPSASGGVGKSDTTGGSSNGSITGVDDTMEYRLITDSSWTDIIGTEVTGLPPGTYEVRVKAVAGTSFPGEATTVVIAGSGSIPPADDDQQSGQTSAPSPGPSTASNGNDVTVFVDGKETSAGEVSSEDGKISVTVNQDLINSEIQNASDNVMVVIPPGDDTGMAEAVFVVKNVDDMAEKEMMLIVQVNNVQYELPATAMDTAAIMEALGATDTAQVPISVVITTNVSAETKAFVQETADGYGMELVLPPMQFTITATYNGQVVQVTEFNQFVSRTVEITEEQAKKITTAVVVDPDGAVRHIPTYVYQEGGKWYATVNSLTNSAYALIYQVKAFSDVEGKSYEAIVNEMVSRGILSGVGGGLFEGERDITRAELVTIIIKALGLPRNGRGAVFSDVSASAWYQGAVGKAYEYGLASGVGGGRFEPDRTVSRQEAMMFLWKTAQLAGFEGKMGGINAFTNAPDLSAWAVDAARWSIGSGLMAGLGGDLKPKENITRGEISAAVLDLLRKARLVDIRSN